MAPFLCNDFVRPHQAFYVSRWVCVILGLTSKKISGKRACTYSTSVLYICAMTYWYYYSLGNASARCTTTLHKSSSHTVHCDLHSARNCALSSLQTSSGHGTGLHVQSAAGFSSLFFSFLFLFLFFFFSFSALAHCFWLADPT